VLDIETFADGYIMDWEAILSNNVTTQIPNYKRNRNVLKIMAPLFYMSTYVMEAICFSYDFPSIGWEWINQFPSPISIYLDILWETKYHSHFYKISHEVMQLIHQEVFGTKAPRLNA